MFGIEGWGCFGYEFCRFGGLEFAAVVWIWDTAVWLAKVARVWKCLDNFRFGGEVLGSVLVKVRD
jgi:hypothetical protein